MIKINFVFKTFRSRKFLSRNAKANQGTSFRPKALHLIGGGSTVIETDLHIAEMTPQHAIRPLTTQTPPAKNFPRDTRFAPPIVTGTNVISATLSAAQLVFI